MTDRRSFLGQLSASTLLAACAGPFPQANFHAAEDPPQGRPLSLGPWEELVGFLQETPPETLIPRLVKKWEQGTTLEDLVAAGALANARAFGGEDYVGFHTLMALVPAYRMALEEPNPRKKPLSIFKVLYRNASRLKESGCGSKNTLAQSVDTTQPGGGVRLRDLARACNLKEAESTLAGICRDPQNQAIDGIMPMVADATEVHRVVLVARSFELLDFVGLGRCETLLRQSVHYCIKAENQANYRAMYQDVRGLLPKVMEEHRLPRQKMGLREADDAWITQMAQTLLQSNPAQAMETAAIALKEGFSPLDLAEAVSLAANELVLRDQGRSAAQASPNKPVGSVHGDSIGVHASDSANAWRFLISKGSPVTATTSCLLAAYQVARDRVERGGDFLTWQPHPLRESTDSVSRIPAGSRLAALEDALRNRDQARASALTALLDPGRGEDQSSMVFDLFRRYALTQDGALHGEKYYHTVREEMKRCRQSNRWRYAIALARVTASGFGFPAPGLGEAEAALKVG